MLPVNGPIEQGFGPTDVTLEPPNSVWPGCNLPTAAHFHAGIDIGVSDGTPVAATGPGTVIFAGWDSTGYGNLVKIDHGQGIVSLYAHLSSFAVYVGQHVNTGDIIGASGQSGNVTGPHVHYEVDVNGCPVDPTSIDSGAVTVAASSSPSPGGGITTTLTTLPKGAVAVGLILAVLWALD